MRHVLRLVQYGCPVGFKNILYGHDRQSLTHSPPHQAILRKLPDTSDSHESLQAELLFLVSMPPLQLLLPPPRTRLELVSSAFLGWQGHSNVTKVPLLKLRHSGEISCTNMEEEIARPSKYGTSIKTAEGVWQGLSWHSGVSSS